MSVRKWLGMVIPFGILCGLALGWMTAGAQHALSQDQVDISRTPHPVYPRINPDPKGWMPVCPDGMDVVRKVPPPDCFWGNRSIDVKPTRGDFECVYTAQAKALPACPKE